MIFLTEDIENPFLDTGRIYAPSWWSAFNQCPKDWYIIGFLVKEV